MSGNYGPRKPLHMQSATISKAAANAHANPSYESFRANIIHPVNYVDMEDRAGTNANSRVRRYPDGKLDFDWIVSHLLDVIYAAETNGPLLPLDLALLTVVFPVKFSKMEPQAAEILTQLSKTEKKLVAALVESKLKEQDAYAAGQGRGATPGAHRTVR